MIDWFKKYIITLILVIILVVMTGFLLAVGLDQTGGKIAQFLGTDKTMYYKKETIELIAWGMSGMLAAIVATVINRRTNAQERNNELIEKGHINDRFQHAATNLGHVKRRVRITSFYQFYHLAKGSEYDFRKNIFDILCDHLRHITSGQFHDEKEEGKDTVTDECQTLLNILFKSKDKPVLDEFHADLKNINLPYADLSNANLTGAKFSYATLIFINFAKANLVGSDFFHADLLQADFKGSIIKKAKMCDATLSCAMFNGADLSEADFTGANLSSANFQGAHLVGADFSGANLTHVKFLDANLSGAKFTNANISEAIFKGAQLENTNLKEVSHINKADFRGAKVGNRSIEQTDLPDLPDFSDPMTRILGKGEYISDWHTLTSDWDTLLRQNKS